MGETVNRTVAIPAPPDELWMLWRSGPFGYWVSAMDDPRDAENYLVCTSERDALNAARHRREAYQIECAPVKVKDARGAACAAELEAAAREVADLGGGMSFLGWRCGRFRAALDRLAAALEKGGGG